MTMLTAVLTIIQYWFIEPKLWRAHRSKKYFPFWTNFNCSIKTVFFQYKNKNISVYW